MISARRDGAGLAMAVAREAVHTPPPTRRTTVFPRTVVPAPFLFPPLSFSHRQEIDDA